MGLGCTLSEACQLGWTPFLRGHHTHPNNSVTTV
jgi:hypothetical protein